MILAAHFLPAKTETTEHPTIVWLHGFLGCGEEWLELAAQLPNFAHLLIDLPGHGGSAERAVADFAAVDAALRGTLKRYAIFSYSLIGYSLGGRVAMYHAVQGAEGLKALLVEGGNPGLKTQGERTARIEHDARWAERFRSQSLREVLSDWYRQPVFAELNEAERKRLVELRSAQVGEPLAAMLEATSLGKQPLLTPSLKTLAIPFVYLCGERDAKFQQLAVESDLPARIIADAGHNAHRANPNEFVTQVRDFLTKHL
ncbi:2-succinyl-6-hydroxy-2,4-cyclohexadiene-1-carboxylate synthase [Hafnia paralvei]|uniref:2-succinyl-6-hydroxy-2, 4-cyclohexadiene-1-carboxylate synthase n=1 Tax=Hafnia paralvei TaxID=546367 RepID=UPI003C2BE0FE